MKKKSSTKRAKYIPPSVNTHHFTEERKKNFKKNFMEWSLAGAEAIGDQCRITEGYREFVKKYFNRDI